MTTQLPDLKLEAEINKIIAETALVNKRTRWYELVVMGGVLVAMMAAGRYLL